MSMRREHYRLTQEHLYRSVGSIGDPCTYCGVESDVMDHVPPIHLADRLCSEEQAQIDFKKLPACTECNVALGGRLLKTVSDRRRHVLRYLRQKYAKFVRMPEWTEEELGTLDPNMADDVRRHARHSRWVKSRIAYYGRA